MFNECLLVEGLVTLDVIADVATIGMNQFICSGTFDGDVHCKCPSQRANRIC